MEWKRDDKNLRKTILGGKKNFNGIKKQKREEISCQKIREIFFFPWKCHVKEKINIFM